MKKSLFIRYYLPFLQWFGLMVVASLAIDYLLHRAHLVEIGRYLGFIGTALILLSFLYSLRKRKMIVNGTPKTFLALHEYLSWVGSVLILVHAGIHFNAVLPWMAVFMMLLVVISGLIGKFLLKKAAVGLIEKQKELVLQGLSVQEADQKLYLDVLTVGAMKKWRVIHLPITLVLGILSILHILSVIIFHE